MPPSNRPRRQAANTPPATGRALHACLTALDPPPLRLKMATPSPADATYQLNWRTNLLSLLRHVLDLHAAIAATGIDPTIRSKAHFLRSASYAFELETEGRIILMDATRKPYPLHDEPRKTQALHHLTKHLADIAQADDIAYYDPQKTTILDGLQTCLTHIAAVFDLNLTLPREAPADSHAVAETPQAGFTPGRLADLAGVSQETLRLYTQKAHVPGPGRGQCNYQYPPADAIRILTTMCEAGSTHTRVKAAEALRYIKGNQK